MHSARFFLAISACIGLILGVARAEAAGQGQRCGGVSQHRCDAGLWCEPRPGRCASPGARGTCVATPQFCTMIYQPVCGCDGKTYASDCVRRTARIAKKHDGAC